MSDETDTTQVDTNKDAVNTTDDVTTESAEGQGNLETAEAGAPEKYETFTLKEGFELTDARKADFEAVARENNLTQAQAQKLVDKFQDYIGETSQASEQARADKIKSWGEEAKTKFGTDYDATIEQAKRAVAHFNNPELVSAFESEGWGNHPLMIQVFAEFGKLIGGSTLHGLGGTTAAAQPRDAVSVLYPNEAKT